MRRWLIFLKVLVALAILWLIRDKFDLQQFISVVNNPLLLLIVPLCWGMNQFFTTMRLHTMLKALDRSAQLSDIFRANFSSLFMGNLMPGVMGADVIKFFYIKKHDINISNTQLVLILSLDRFFGLLAILFWCSVFSFIIDTSTYTDKLTILLIHLPIILLGAFVASFFAINILLKYMRRFTLPTVIQDLVATFMLLISTKQKKLLVMIMVYNLLAVFVVLAGLVVVGSFLHERQTGQAMMSMQLFLIPLSLIVSMLPLTPMGIGVVQVTMGGAYALFGLDPSVGVSVSTSSQIGMFIVSILIGGPFFLSGKKSTVLDEKDSLTNEALLKNELSSDKLASITRQSQGL